jgi:Tfp pilus assembly protein PilN
MIKYLKPFLIIIIIYPFVSWIFDLALGREQRVWPYILSAPLVGILFVILSYSQNRRKVNK